MRNVLLLVLLVGSLAGLGVVQYQLLVTGIRAEKIGFDREVQLVLQDVRQQLQGGGTLAIALSDAVAADGSDTAATRALRDYAAARLRARGIDVAFSFVLTGEQVRRTYLQSADYQPAAFDHWTYSVLLDGYPAQRCSCILYFHLGIPDLYGYLVRSLANLLVPLVLFLLLILGGLGYLIYLLNRRERLQRVQNDFINNLTHELKTPVFAISVAAKVLRRNLFGGTPEKSTEYLDLIERENVKLKGHIDKVLELASLESTGYQLELDSTDPRALIDRVVTNFRYRVKERGGELVLHYDAPPLSVAIDADHFTNVLENLLDNALKYGPEGGCIQVRVEQLEKQLRVSVTDAGAGIPAEAQRRIFDKFYRVQKGNLHEVKGFGLGLNYVREVMRAHGGTAGVRSRVGEGAEFWVALDLAPAGC